MIGNELWGMVCLLEAIALGVLPCWWPVRRTEPVVADDGHAALRDKIKRLEEEMEVAKASYAEVSRSRHEILCDMRYVIQRMADLIDAECGHPDLAVLAQALPYILSGRREWGIEVPGDRDNATDLRAQVSRIVGRFGYQLPREPDMAIKVMLMVANDVLRDVRAS